MDINDFKHLYKSSQFIGNWIHRQLYVREESLTEWLLFDMSENIRGVYYQSFSGLEEARRTRADWEWWFLFSGFCFAMRVKAKKLHPAADNYPGIAHTNIYGLQIEKLLDDAARGNFMPFYVFYTDQRAEVMCPNQRNDEGVFVAGGQKIYDTFMSGPREQVMAADVLRHTLSLSCFVCCPLVSGAGSFMQAESGELDGGDRWRSSIINYYRSELSPGFGDEKTSIPEYENIPGMRKEVPHYVESFVGLRGKRLPDWWEHEFSGDIEGTNALLVYDLRS
ncbi:hypothetical protein ACFLW2_04365 [Chloroflexota bacterium]